MNKDPKHIHTYDAEGQMTCCSLEDKIYINAGAENLIKQNKTIGSQNEVEKSCCDHDHEDDHGHDEDHDHSHSATSGASNWQLFMPAIISIILLIIALFLDHGLMPSWFSGWPRLVFYIVAYLPVGYPVLKEAWKSIVKGEFFSEFLLMGIATIGAFAIGEYPEGVAVMLFYAVGEGLQTLAVKRAKANIKSLLDQRPDVASIIVDGQVKTVKATDVKIGDIIQLKAGEKLGLDGELISETASFNTAALTGESKPDTKSKGDLVLAGMINLQILAQVKVTTQYSDSKLSKILAMVQDATSKKAPTELFIRKFAKIYTPIVVLLAFAICLLPYFIVETYEWRDWLYKALVFLVISCPCALVISIPLGYFGGIGAASRHGILVKGSNFLDVLASISHVVMDKTGTLTEGVFKVQEVVFNPSYDQGEILQMVNALESKSTHPVATAIHDYVGNVDSEIVLTNTEEIPGLGLKATIQDKELLVGNFKLMDKYGIKYDAEITLLTHTVIAVAYDHHFVGYISIADRIKQDAKTSIDSLKKIGVNVTMLSGDKSSVVKHVANSLGIHQAFGDLLPEDKVHKVNEIKSAKESVAFVGDGVNDAPVVALSDVGIAMGGLGSDATIETADVVIQDDSPSKIPLAIKIGKQTKRIVWQNISLAFIVKAVVLVLGAGGLATIWEAVFADVGVALLAILNAVRIQRMNF